MTGRAQFISANCLRMNYIKRTFESFPTSLLVLICFKASSASIIFEMVYGSNDISHPVFLLFVYANLFLIFFLFFIGNLQHIIFQLAK